MSLWRSRRHALRYCTARRNRDAPLTQPECRDVHRLSDTVIASRLSDHFLAAALILLRLGLAAHLLEICRIVEQDRTVAHVLGTLIVLRDRHRTLQQRTGLDRAARFVHPQRQIV